MKRLFLLRHSNAVYASFGQNDFDRKLTPAGIEIALNQAKKMRSFNYRPDIVATSSAVRAIQTTELVMEELSLTFPIQKEEFLYHDYTTSDFINWLSKFKNNANQVLVTGHNPILSNIAGRLTPNLSKAFKPCMLVVIDFKVDEWSQIEAGKGNLVNILEP